MKVSELIRILEDLPQDSPVISDCKEITECVIRNEVYFSEDYIYKEDLIIKLY